MGNQRHDAKSNVHTMGIVPARQRVAEFLLALVLVEALVEALLVVLVVQPSRARSQLCLHQVWWQLFGPLVLGSEQFRCECHYRWWCPLVAHQLRINAISRLVALSALQP